MMATDTKTGAGRAFDATEMAKTWKEGYLKGLEASLEWQEQSEHLVKDAVRQGLAAPRQWLASYRDLLVMHYDQIQGQTNGVPSPFLDFTRQVLQTSQDMAEPLLKTAADACETAFEYYETSVAGPSRKFALEINKKVMDTVIPN